MKLYQIYVESFLAILGQAKSYTRVIKEKSWNYFEQGHKIISKLYKKFFSYIRPS